MITSTSNTKIKNVIKYSKSSKDRRRADVFLVEGIRMFSEIPKELLLETYVTEEFEKKNPAVLQQVSYELVSDHVMAALADTKTPQGVVSVVKRLHYTLEEVCNITQAPEKSASKEVSTQPPEKRVSKEVFTQPPLLIALENLQDPGNLGTIIRTAEGAGVTGVIMSKDTVDIYNPKVVRSTMGSIFRVPFCYVEDFVEEMKKLKASGIVTFSAHLQGTSFYDQNYKKPTAFVIGNEGNGLTDAVSSVTSQKISIPMMGQVESLNAATAATVLMYEAMRQRTS